MNTPLNNLINEVGYPLAMLITFKNKALTPKELNRLTLKQQCQILAENKTTETIHIQILAHLQTINFTLTQWSEALSEITIRYNTDLDDLLIETFAPIEGTVTRWTTFLQNNNAANKYLKVIANKIKTLASTFDDLRIVRNHSRYNDQDRIDATNRMADLADTFERAREVYNSLQYGQVELRRAMFNKMCKLTKNSHEFQILLKESLGIKAREKIITNKLDQLDFTLKEWLSLHEECDGREPFNRIFSKRIQEKTPSFEELLSLFKKRRNPSTGISETMLIVVSKMIQRCDTLEKLMSIWRECRDTNALSNEQEDEFAKKAKALVKAFQDWEKLYIPRCLGTLNNLVLSNLLKLASSFDESHFVHNELSINDERKQVAFEKMCSFTKS